MVRGAWSAGPVRGGARAVQSVAARISRRSEGQGGVERGDWRVWERWGTAVAAVVTVSVPVVETDVGSPGWGVGVVLGAGIVVRGVV